MTDIFGNPLPGENTGVAGNPATGSYGTTTGQFTDGPNPWLQSAMSNTQNPNLNYSSYLKSLGFDIEEDKVGKFFSGITDQYSQDINMARSGMAQNMQGLQSGATNQLMQIGGGQGLQGAYNPGFGRTQYGLNQAISGIGDQYGQGLQSGLLDFTQQKLDAQRDVQSEIRDVAMGLIGQDASGISWGNTDIGGDNEPPSYNNIGINPNIPNTEKIAIDSATYGFNQTNPDGTNAGDTATNSVGMVFTWNGTEWVYTSGYDRDALIAASDG